MFIQRSLLFKRSIRANITGEILLSVMSLGVVPEVRGGGEPLVTLAAHVGLYSSVAAALVAHQVRLAGE